MKFNFDKKKLKKLTEFSIVLVPYNPSTGTKTIKLSFSKIITILLVYNLIIMLLGFYLITLSSADKILLPDSYVYNTPEKAQLSKLNEKIIKLANEIQKLKSNNERLKNILSQQDSSLFNENTKKNNSKSTKNSTGGNVFAAFVQFIKKFFINQETSVIFIKPIDGYISRKFDPENGHFGIDFATKENNPIFASAAGYISFAGYTPEYGYVVVINHSDNFITRYMHCAMIVKKQGEKVFQGELIALAGNSGTRTSGTHLHFEIWLKGKPVDPEKFLTKF
ncbi:MAG: M23 family metallopeptidase [Ignavibacterium sp.]|uniref:M23 family metallopeptidase n=1 Tax=Ignavibacterium sp. TaxID=2651167 RepID=UPI0040497ED7